MGNKTKPIHSVTSMGVTNSDLLDVARPITLGNDSKKIETTTYQSGRVDIKNMLTKSAAATALAIGLFSSNGFVESATTTQPMVQNQFMIGKQIPKSILDNPNTHINVEVSAGTGAPIQSGFVIQPYIIPTLEPEEIKYKGNEVYVDGIEFLQCNISPNTKFTSNGSLYKPYVKKPLEVTISTPITQMFITQFLPQEVSNIVKANWNLGPIKEAGGNPNALASYDGKGHYVFKVATPTLGLQSLGSSGENVFYLETPNSITYKQFLTDLNTLYKFNKTSAVFYGDNNKEFIKEFLKRDDEAHHILQLRTNIGRVVQGITMTYNVLGEPIVVNLPNEFIHKLSTPEQVLKSYIPEGVSFNDMFCIYRGEEFKYQKVNYVPGFGDGTKEFPFQINKNRPIWSGRGYYAFTDINSFPMPRSFESTSIIHAMSTKEISNKDELKLLYKKIYENGSVYQNPNSKENAIFYGVTIGKYKFIYGGRTNVLGINNLTTRNYQDGSILHPYINNKFTKKGHYKINGVITPVVNSNMEYNKLMQIISTNQFLKTFSTELLSRNYGIGINNSSKPSNMAQLKEKQLQDLASRVQGRLVYDKYGRPIAIVSKDAQISIFEPPIPKVTTKEKAQALNYEFYEKYDKIINGVKFDLINNDKNANERTGTIKNPFLANEGPRGIAYYQIGGTNLMTPIPVDGFKLGPWFAALNRKLGSNFVVSQLPYGDGATVYKEKVGNYEVYRYNKEYTDNFGTITQPYTLNKHGSPNFTEGTPSFFRVKGSDGLYYVNAMPISTVNELEKFYSALTNKKLGPKFHTRGKTFTVETKGNGIEISELLRR